VFSAQGSAATAASGRGDALALALALAGGPPTAPPTGHADAFCRAATGDPTAPMGAVPAAGSTVAGGGFPQAVPDGVFGAATGKGLPQADPGAGKPCSMELPTAIPDGGALPQAPRAPTGLVTAGCLGPQPGADGGDSAGGPKTSSAVLLPPAPAAPPPPKAVAANVSRKQIKEDNVNPTAKACSYMMPTGTFPNASCESGTTSVDHIVIEKANARKVFLDRAMETRGRDPFKTKSAAAVVKASETKNARCQRRPKTSDQGLPRIAAQSQTNLKTEPEPNAIQHSDTCT
jgi:hypothetical protein